MSDAKFTRADYLDNKCTHEEYYDQFVNAGLKNLVIAKFTEFKLKNSKDEFFNDIPLIMWDNLTHLISNETLGKMARANNPNRPSLSLADKVCVLKRAADHVRRELNKE